MLSNNATPAPVAASERDLDSGLRSKLLLALACAASLEFTARIAKSMHWAPLALTELLSVAAIALACTSVVILVSRTRGSRMVNSLMLLAAMSFGCSVLLHNIANVPALVSTPVLGSEGAFHAIAVHVADSIGIGAWFFGFFGLVFELDETKGRLQRQRARLVSEIEERKQAENILRESESRFRAVFDQVGISMIVMSPDGTVVECNEAVSEELGYTHRQLHGTGILSLVHEDDREPVRFELDALGAGQSESRQFEHRLICRDEAVFWYCTTATLVHLESDTPGFIVALLENITARRLREHQVQQRQKMESLGLLAGGIAHDFNNLLVGIMANAELLANELPGDPPAAGVCGDIVQSAQRAAALCNQLLAYAGKAPKSEQALSLTGLVLQSQELLRAALGRQANLEFKCASLLPSIKGDPSHIRQVVLSLISNAADALDGAGGTVQIMTGVASLGAHDFGTLIHETAGMPGDYVYVSVTDSGVGMTEDAVTRIFDPFYTTKHLGTGLGLAAVAGLVRAHHGMISIRSTAGAGTTITVYFPPTSEEAAPVPETPPPPEPATKPAGGGTVLVVDDEDVVRRTAQRVLERNGYRVLTAVDGQDGVEVFERRHAELAAVLLDLTMPRMNGATACRKMRAIDAKVPIILSSGFSENENTDPTLMNEAAGYIRKPYRIQQLLDLLRDVT